MMTIGECRNRKRRYKRLMKKIEKGCSMLENATQEDLDVIRIAIARSIAIEDLNIAKLKEVLNDKQDN